MKFSNINDEILKYTAYKLPSETKRSFALLSFYVKLELLNSSNPFSKPLDTLMKDNESDHRLVGPLWKVKFCHKYFKTASYTIIHSYP